MKLKRANGVTQPLWMTTLVKRAINLKKKTLYVDETRGHGCDPGTVPSKPKDLSNFNRKCKRDHEKRIAREAKTNPKQFFFTYVRTIKNIKKKTLAP